MPCNGTEQRTRLLFIEWLNDKFCFGGCFTILVVGCLVSWYIDQYRNIALDMLPSKRLVQRSPQNCPYVSDSIVLASLCSQRIQHCLNMFWPELVELIPAEMGNEMLAYNLRISINGAGLIPSADDLTEPALQKLFDGDALGRQIGS